MLPSSNATSAKLESPSAEKSTPLTFASFSRERPRTFHEFVLLLTMYDRLTRDKRRCVRGSILESLSAAERALCAGTFRKSPARDIVRLLCYGARTNVNRMRDVARLRMRRLGFDSIFSGFPTDAAMMKHVDLWYEFGTSCKFDGNVLAENIADAFDVSTTTTRFDGRCRMCVNAILRLARTGLCGELTQRDSSESSEIKSREATTSAVATLSEKPPPTVRKTKTTAVTDEGSARRRKGKNRHSR